MVNKKFEISITEYNTDPDFKPQKFRELSTEFVVPNQLFIENSALEVCEMIVRTMNNSWKSLIDLFCDNYVFDLYWRPISNRKVRLNEVISLLVRLRDQLKSLGKKISIKDVEVEFNKLFDKLMD